jgi:Mn2+/Fe2+ NRAMP family transporter
MKVEPPAKQSPIRLFIGSLGPGLITGASDDDPSGIATYSQVGAQFGVGMLWTMLFTYPLMAVIQEISAQIGRTTGRGIAAIVAKYYSRWLLYAIVIPLFLANALNIGADLGAMAQAAKLLVPGLGWSYVLAFGLISIFLEVFVPYTRYVFYLKWMTLSLFAYVITAFIIHVPWKQTLYATFVPRIAFNKTYLVSLVAVLGTTLSPYLLFWQASEEAEEVRDHAEQHPLRRSPAQAPAQLRRIRIDTYVGMGFSNLVAYFIILTAVFTLHAHGITDIETAAQAAQSLKPVAGRFAFLLFALGIIGTGFLTIPVLAGSSAYGLGEALGLRVGLEKKPRRAKGFYAILAASTLIGVLLNALKVNPIKALIWSAVINGVVAVPVMVVVMLIAANRRVMGAFVLPPFLKVMGWLTTSVMLLAAVGLCPF